MTTQTQQATTVYDFSAERLGGGEVTSLSNYSGSVILIVNTASKCGMTPQYEGLEELYQKYKDDGLIVLGFPCNQFAGQEPGDASRIRECLVNYGVSFPMFEKIKVNGKSAHPLYKFLKSSLPAGILGSGIKWNFTKFLVDRNGKPVKRFAPSDKPEQIEPHIRELLQG